MKTEEVRIHFEVMRYRTSGLVIWSCLSLHLLTACNPPSQSQQMDLKTEAGEIATHTVPFQAKNITAPPQGITAPPENITAPPENITAPPQGITAPPQNITAPPQGITAPPQNLWVNPALKPLQLALANYHEVDASFHDAYRLQHEGVAGGYRTQLLGWVKETVTEVVDEVQGTVEAVASSAPQSEDSSLVSVNVDAPSNADGLLNPLLTASTDVLQQALETVEQTVQQVPLVHHLFALDLDGLLGRLLPVPTQSLYRLQSRRFEAQQASEAVVLPEGVPANLTVLQLSHALRERQIVTLTPERVLQDEGGQRLTESGTGFSQQATRTRQWVSGQWRTLTQVVTSWENGTRLKISEERLSSAEGLGTGQGVIVFTLPDGSQQRFTFLTQTQAEGGLSSQASFEEAGILGRLKLDESASGEAVLSYQSGENTSTLLELDFDIMLKSMGES